MPRGVAPRMRQEASQGTTYALLNLASWNLCMTATGGCS
jgi:hypothetical protein